MPTDRKKLDWWKYISLYWKKEPAAGVLGVILPRPAGSESAVAILTDLSQIVAPATDQRPSKRRCLGGGEVDDEPIPGM